MSATARRPLIVAIGGTTRANSSTEKALRHALRHAQGLGCETLFFGQAELDLPMYSPEKPERSDAARALVDAVRRADGIIVGSPGYHGSVSGLVKNALDYTEDLREDTRVYLDGRAVGCIATATGWQATVTTLNALRSIVHALRGWPTPLGVTINTAEPVFDAAGECISERVAMQLREVAAQVVAFARLNQTA